jgi:hypothetical protein
MPSSSSLAWPIRTGSVLISPGSTAYSPITMNMTTLLSTGAQPVAANRCRALSTAISMALIPRNTIAGSIR